MHKSPINQPPLPRIRRNIAKLPSKILSVANPMLMESHLPDFATKLCAQLMREPALDALRAALNCLVRPRSQQNVQRFRHHGEPMQLEPPLISIVQERLDQQLGMSCHNKQRPPLVRRCRERIGFHFGLEEHTSGDQSPSACAGVKTPAYRQILALKARGATIAGCPRSRL
jgi:hypothetical protein